MCLFVLCFFKDTATTVIYTYCHTLSLHDALPICAIGAVLWFVVASDRRSMRAAPLSALRHLRSATPIIRCSAAFSAFASIRHRQRRARLNRSSRSISASPSRTRRSDERRVGKQCVSHCRSWLSPYL